MSLSIVTAPFNPPDYEKQSSRYGIYKFVLDGNIIYLGKADNGIDKRIKEHGKPGCNINESGWPEINAADVYYIVLPNEKVTNFVEVNLLKRYKPKWNNKDIDEDNLWDEFPIEEPTWTKYEENPGYPYNPNIPKYLQSPLSGSKLNTLQQRIINNYRHWFLLNSIKTQGMTPGHSYFMDADSAIFPSFCYENAYGSQVFLSGYNHQHRYIELITKYRDSVSIKLVDNKNNWLSYIDHGIAYYANELRKEMHFLQENYKTEGLNIKHRNGRKRSLKTIIGEFNEWDKSR